MRTLFAIVVAMASLGAAAAHAEEGFTTANVNMRTGPDIDYPSIGVIPEGDPVYVEGCLRDESWCDVSWEDERGWVFSEYLAFDYRGEAVPLPDIGLEVFRIPIVEFRFVDYWDRYYVGRPWYRDRLRWRDFRPRPRVGWRAPPPGPRRRGWWRSGYSAPFGMRPPPDRGWRRPVRERYDRHDRGDRIREHYERRDDRRDFRRDDRDHRDFDGRRGDGDRGGRDFKNWRRGDDQGGRDGRESQEGNRGDRGKKRGDRHDGDGDSGPPAGGPPAGGPYKVRPY
jgi:uncharacterized protein YraI